MGIILADAGSYLEGQMGPSVRIIHSVGLDPHLI
jgi:hypothetical protein